MRNTLNTLLLIVLSFYSFGQSTYSFKVEKSGSGTPILMIPGLSSSGEVWHRSAEKLKATHECHIVTLPGFAEQPAITSDNYLKTVGDELLTYIKENELKELVVMGHSLGGFLSLYLGTQLKTELSKLIIVDGLPFLGAAQNPMAIPETVKKMAEMMKQNITKQTDEQFETSQPRLLATMITDPKDVEIAMEWSRKSDRESVGQAMYELYQWDLRKEIAAIEQPTLIFGSWYGYKDYGATAEMVKQNFELQFDAMENKTILISAKGKHFIMWDDEKFFLEQVKSFLQPVKAYQKK